MRSANGQTTVTPPSSLTVANGQLYFVAGTPGGSSGGAEGLWVSNGLPGGTLEFDDALPIKTVTVVFPGSPTPTTQTLTPFDFEPDRVRDQPVLLPGLLLFHRGGTGL